MTLTGAPALNPQTGARRYTPAEFVIHLWRINGTSAIDLAPEPPKPARKRVRRKPKS
jgi:hypothetical protein